MEKELKYIDLVEQPISMHPKKFALWLFMVTVVMIFAALTSAYIVRQAEGNWLEYDLPQVFWFTSGIVVLSSLFLHWAYISAKKRQPFAASNRNEYGCLIGNCLFGGTMVQLGCLGRPASILCG